MKRLLPATLIAFTLLASTSAFANDINLDVSIGGGAPSGSVVIGQPAVVVPAPQTVIVEHPDYDPHHIDRDHKYWEERKAEERREQERKERERAEHERMEHERHEHAEHHKHHDDHEHHDDHAHHDDHDDRDDHR